MSLDEEEETEEWDHGYEDHDEFAYEEYALPYSTKRKRDEMAAQADAREVAPPADAFVGKHCPICLGEISHSSSVIETCKHIYCTTCLFEVGERGC